MAKEENKVRVKGKVEKRNQQASEDKEIKKKSILKKIKTKNNIFYP